MHRIGIGIVATALLIVLPIFCSVSFAQDQGQALIQAAVQGKLETVKNLLSEGVDVNSKDEDDMTALILASDRGHAEVVKALLDAGADVDAKDKNGSTALKKASMTNHREVVKLLKAHGAKE